MSSLPPRVTSLDAYRGFVMLLMLLEALTLADVAKKFPSEPVWQAVKVQTSHVEWEGCSLHDLIQPSFSFLVGAAAVFSIAARRHRGEAFWKSLLHAVFRSVFLVLWGVVLRSFDKSRTYWTFEDTLSQIGLGYVPLFLLAHTKPKWWWATFAGILVSYWLFFALPPMLAGEPLASAWVKNQNPATEFDLWFLNLFPREKPFEGNRGGYCTLSFIPTLATMILGLVAGWWLQSPGGWKAAGRLAVAGVVGVLAGWLLVWCGVCPVVKKIWTPSWVLFSGGWCFLLLAAFHSLSDGIRYRGWTYPLRVIGANSILIYSLADSPVKQFVIDQLAKHLPPAVWDVFGEAARPVAEGLAWLAVAWLLLWWMYRKRWFVRV